MPAITRPHTPAAVSGGSAGGIGQRAPTIRIRGRGDVLLDVRMVSKRFGGVRAVEDVSIAVRRGAIVSIIGPNGAGKTSLLNMISGFYQPDTGRIMLEGRDITRSAPGRDRRARRSPAPSRTSRCSAA